jgi:protoheme IX farnesyltransferase
MAVAMAGTLLAAAGAAALNEVADAALDARMPRTLNRPIPAGRVRPGNAGLLGASLVVLGIAILAAAPESAFIAAGLGLLAVLLYNAVYTPLKRASAWASVPGAAVGALPPLIGWTVAGGSLGNTGVWMVAAFYFAWQLPHSWVIALRRDHEVIAAGLPALTERHTRERIGRMAFVGTLVIALVGPIAAIAADQPSWSIATIGAAATALVVLASRLPMHNRDEQVLKRAFHAVNLYAVVVTLALILGALSP